MANPKNPCDPCELHEMVSGEIRETILVITTIRGDLQWVVSLGKWIIGMVGGALCIILPFIIALMVHISAISTKCTVLEEKISEIVIDFRLNQARDSYKK